MFLPLASFHMHFVFQALQLETHFLFEQTLRWLRFQILLHHSGFITNLAKLIKFIDFIRFERLNLLLL